MRMSDVIEEFIKDLFDEDESNFIEIQRNELAQHFNCVPSQINYVISTRFKPSQGYYVESKRGGGGNIKIKKISNTKKGVSTKAPIINKISNKVIATSKTVTKQKTISKNNEEDDDESDNEEKEDDEEEDEEDD